MLDLRLLAQIEIAMRNVYTQMLYDTSLLRSGSSVRK